MSIYVVRTPIESPEKLSILLNSYLKDNLSPPRYAHSISVARMCRDLCQRFNHDPHMGFLTGLCHDIAREYSKNFLLSRAIEIGYRPEGIEKERPVLLHGRIGAEILRGKFDFQEEEILLAVNHHSLGHPDFGILGKSLYVADYCEPGRKHVEDVFRKSLENLSLDDMVLMVLRHEKNRRKTLAPITQAMYDKLEGSKSAR